MLSIRKRIGRATWLDNVWPAFRAIAKLERRFLSVFYRMRHNSGRATNSGGRAISAGTNRRDLAAQTVPKSVLNPREGRRPPA